MQNPAHKYKQVLDHLESEIGGVGPKRRQAIENEFPNPDEFFDACRDAYDNRNFDTLTEINGVGKSYAQNKIARPVAEFLGWSGGDAEPTKIQATSGL